MTTVPVSLSTQRQALMRYGTFKRIFGTHATALTMVFTGPLDPTERSLLGQSQSAVYCSRTFQRSVFTVANPGQYTHDRLTLEEAKGFDP